MAKFYASPEPKSSDAPLAKILARSRVKLAQYFSALASVGIGSSDDASTKNPDTKSKREEAIPAAWAA